MSMSKIIPIRAGAAGQGRGRESGAGNKDDRYRALFKNARDAILTIRDGQPVDFNPAVLDLFKCSDGQVRKGPFPEAFSPRRQPDGRPSAEAIRERITLALSGIPQSFPWRHIDCHGQPIDAEISLNRVDLAGEALIQAVIRDVTLFTRYAEAVRNSQTRFQGLFASMVEGVALHQLVYSPAGRAEDYIIEEVNPAYERILNRKRADVIGCRSTEVYGTDTPPFLDLFSRVVDTGVPSTFEIEFEPLKKHFSISAFSPGKGRIAAVFTDISDGKRVEAELARHRTYLEVLLGKRDLQLAEASDQVQAQVDRRLKAEASLKESEQRYRTVFENAGSGMVILDSDMTISLANAEVERICGYSRGEIEGKVNGFDLLVPEDARRLKENRKRRLAGETIPCDYECRITTKAGEVRNILLKIGTIAETDKTVISIVDITERKAAEAALKISEASYRKLFRHAGAPTMIVEADMTIAMINPKFEELFGFSRSEVEGKMPWTRLVHPGDAERMMGYHRRRRQPGGNAPSEYECRFLDRSGDVHHIHFKVGMLPGGSRSIASLLDITEHIQAENALKQSRAQLREIIDATDGYIYTVGSDFRIGFMNKAMIKHAGGGDVTGEHCYAVMHARKTPCPWCVNDRVFQGETVKQELENPLDGRWYYTISSPIFGGDGSVKEKQSVVVDITDRKAAEEAIRENQAHLRKENKRLRANLQDRYRFGDIIGKSPAMQKVYDLILNAAGTDANTIVYGESGTGKELVARAIHDMSDRREMEFVPVNCGAIPEHLLESEFFGYKKGAFTGASSDKRGFLDIADGGTLFLDELGEIGLSMQVKLLRAIEGGGFTPVGGRRPRKPDVRIVAATNRNLGDLVKSGGMREDFYYRIHVIPISLPPLRERKEDLPLLVDHFLRGRDGEKPLPPVTGRILDQFHQYHWPGNVRELENVLSRYLTLKQLDFSIDTSQDTIPAAKADPPDLPEAGAQGLKSAVEQYEKALIRRALDRNQWQKARVASLLGIHRKTLFTKMKQYNLG